MEQYNPGNKYLIHIKHRLVKVGWVSTLGLEFRGGGESAIGRGWDLQYQSVFILSKFCMDEVIP